MNKYLAILISLVLIVGLISAGGIVAEITEPIVKEKTIPDTEYQELKVVLEKENVLIDDKIGLDVKWVEEICEENVCVYSLYKENLFNGATIQVNYPVDSKQEERQALLEKAIQDKVDFVKNVWAERQTVRESKPIEETKQEGTTKIISDKTIIEEPVKP